MDTFRSLFEETVRTFRKKTAVKDPVSGKCLTYGALDDLAGRIAAKLAVAGVQKGNAVAVVLPHSIECIASILACMKLGAPCAPLNGLYPPDRLAYIFQDCRAKVVITPDFLSDIADSTPIFKTADLSPEDPALLIYTSGSTGNPKGVLINHRAVFDAVVRTVDVAKPDASDVIGLGAPFFFIAGSQLVFCALSIGAGCVMIPVSAMRDPVELSKILGEQQVTITFISPKMLRYFRPAPDSKLRLVCTGSERLSGIWSDEFSIINCYGLSESCGNALAFRLDKAYDNTPVGKPAGNLSAYLLDENGREAKEGELCLTGNFASCYLNRPEESSKTFVENPFREKDGHPKMLRTGDLAKRLPDGNILYLNRRDWMVKINGQRVEPGEIEAALRKAPGITDAAVKDFTDRGGSTYLTAYYVSRQEITDETLRLFLAESLPSYMIPAFFVRLEKLPVNANGKLDRSALAAPDAGKNRAAYAAPETPAQERLCKAFEEILGVERVGLDDDFFALGGDSVKAAGLLSFLQDLPLAGADLYMATTVRKLSEIIASRTASVKEQENLPVNAASAKVTHYPLTPMERGMYLEQKLSPESVSYNLNIGFFIEGERADAEAIKAAIRALFRGHESLHARYGEEGGVPCRILTDEVPEVIDGDTTDRVSFEAMLEDPGRPFDLEKGAPARLTLYPLTEGGFGLHMQIHHIAFDGGSAGPFVKELIARLKGGSVPENAPDLYGMTIRAKGKEAGDPDSLAFFEKMFEDGVPVNEMPTKGPRPKSMPTTDTVLSVDVDEREILALEKKAGLFEMTLFELLLSASAVTLGQYCAGGDVVIGVPVDTRDTFSSEMIGMFVNTVPVRMHPGRSRTLSDFFAESVQTIRQATRARSVPYDELVGHFCPSRDTSRNPLFDMSVNYLPVPEAYHDETLSVDAKAPLQQMPRDIGLVIRRGKASLQILMQYSSQLYDRDVMENFLEQLREGMRRLAFGSAMRVRDLAVLPEGQAAKLEVLSCAAQADIPETLLHRVFEKVAVKNAGRTALIACDRTLTYEALNREANRVSQNLIAHGLKRGESVVLLLPRRSFYFTALFGVLKAGAAFIPCDPEYPAERIRHIIEDSGAAFILTTPEHLKDYPAGKALEIGALLTNEDRRDPENPDVALTGDDLAYMIYTSGSTGRPKGVMLRHAGICNFCTAHPANILYETVKEQVERMLAVTTVSFDLSLKDTLGILCNGKTVVFASETQMNDPRELAELIRDHEVDAMNATPSRYQQYLEYPPFAEALAQCGLVMAGGEGFPKALLGRLLELGIPKIINTYGPTETTISSNMAFLSSADHISVGRPLLNVREYIVDADGLPTPRGVTGELLIGGPGVAKGYRNLDEQTAERFVEYHGERFYRSGDYARWDAQGNVEILGRMDSQVKLRGLRIELGEIEALMERQKGIRQAVVAVRKLGGQEQLCAWYTADDEIDVTALRDALKKELTAYMVPVSFTRLDTIPVTANGKTDLKALPEPEILKDEIVPPQNEMQQKIFDIAAGVMGHSDFGIKTELFAAGLTSLNSVSLSLKLSEAFSVNVQIRDFREHDTVEKLEQYILSLPKEEDFPVQEDYALTKIQEGIFFETQTHPGTTIYNIPTLIILNDAIDPARLKGAVVSAVEAHPYLKVRFFMNEKGEIRQKRMDAEPFTEADITETSCEDIDEIRDTLVQPFDLLRDRLLRVQLVKAGQKTCLFLDVHHIIFDGSARVILMKDISRAYAGETLTPEKYSGYEAVLLEERIRSSEHYEKAKAYYAQLFAGCEPDCLPLADSQDPALTGSGTVVADGAYVDAEEIATFCEKNELSANAFYTAAFGYTIARYAGREDAVFTTVNSGRNDPRFAESVSMFVRTYPVLCRAKDLTVLDYIRQTGRQLLDSLTYDAYSFEELSRELGIRADLIFAYQGLFSDDGDSFCGLPCERINLELNEAKAGIEFQAYPHGKTVTYYCNYQKALYTEGFIRDFLHVYERVLAAFLSGEKLSDIELTDVETAKLLDSFNETERDYERTDIVTMLRRRFETSAENPAVIFGDRVLTYRETDEISERIAARIREKGIGRQDVVSVLIPRSEHMVTVSVGVLKSGAAYQPLDPGYPPERLEFMITDAGAKLLIADRTLLDRVPGYNGDVLCLDEIPALPETERISDNPNPEDAFILLYTSGSTGTPKGVVLEHRNLCNFCNWYRKYFDLTSDSRVAAYASYGFDACMMDLYPALTTGAAVVIVPDQIRLDLAAIARYFDENGVTHSFMTTQVGRQFAAFYSGTTLKHLLVGGETLTPVELINKSFTFHNGYGPTECTIFSTIFPVDRLYQRVPIGKPLDNVRLYVVDAQGWLLPPGLPGELWVAGHQVGRGYFNRPEKTAEVFISNPFTQEAGYERVYRTGDVVRWTRDGLIDFVGRSDGQVKIRGFRIELTEVEGVIREFPGIKDATVQAFDAPSGGKYLAAYLVGEGPIDLDALRGFIAKKKPPYMVPEAMMQIERIPLTQNQKVDKRALPLPERKAAVADEGGDRELTALEKELVDVCAQVLGSHEIGVNTALTEAGLTSITTMQLMALLEKKYGYSPDVSELMRDMRLIDIENALVAHWRESGGLQERKSDEEEEAVMSAPVTQTQLGIYLACRLDETSDRYNIPFLLKVGAEADEKRLAEAIRAAVEAHPAMKCSIEPDKDDIARMVAHPDLAWEVAVEKSDLTDEALEAALTGERVVFKLSRAPLFAFKIVRGQTHVYLSMVFHHILMDGTSVAVLMEDIEKAYQGKALEQESYSSLQLCLDEKKRRSGDELTAAKAVYDGILSGVSVNSLPDPEKSADPEGTGKAAGALYELTDLKAADAEAFCNSCQVTENALFTAAFALLLGRMGGCDEALFASIFNGRTSMETLRIMGMLVKTYPVYVSWEKSSRPADFVKTVQTRIRELTANDLYSFAEAVRDYGVNADILFAYQGDSFKEFTLASQTAGRIDRPLEDAKSPLSVDVWKKDGKYILSIEYREDMYTEGQIRWMADIYGMLVRGLINGKAPGEIPLLSENARGLLREVNDTDVPVPFRPVHCLMESAAAKDPEHLAVITPTARVTYRELNESANRIAHALTDLGAAGRVVSLMLPRSEQVYMVRQGILKAGGAFLSIVPDYPDDRIRAMVEDSKSAALIVTEALLRERGDFLKSLPCPPVTVEKLLADTRTDNPNPDVKKDDLAYCIFTSGSTGRPKGVMLTQGNLVNFLDDNEKNREILGYTERGHVSLALAAITFDVSIMEEFIPLAHGLTICMATEEEIHNPVALSKLMVENRVDVMSCTPSFLSNCIGLSVMKEALGNIVSYDMGAEAFPAALYDKIRSVSPNAYIMNGYGPTEATISCTMDPVTDPGLITIGRPSANVQAYILDEQGSILPPLLPGELVIAGEGVGLGYVGMLDLTAEKFITLEGHRAYRTGDLAAFTSDGRLRFHGRADDQVKLRGLRIELGEIENAINAVPGVLMSIVIMTGKENNRFLAGFYTASRDISPEALREEIGKTLAPYMVPGVLTRLDAMPLTVNGKIDKKKLPKVEYVPDHRAYEAPEGEAEQFFCKLFGEVLDVDGIGATDDFFACGGTSLTATSVMIKAGEGNYPISYGDVFKYKTPRALAALFSGKEAAGQRSDAKPADPFADYDYTAINELLSKNTIESFAGGESRPIGNILLTGATGYMGIHVLEEYLRSETGKVWCLVRKGKYKSALERLKYTMFYYFQDPLSGMEERIEVIDGDVTDYEAFRALEQLPVDTVFNCAANVKHFSSGTDIEDINVGGVENALRFCEATGARLIHFSTTSVGGYLNVPDPSKMRQLDEQTLYFGQMTNNQYITSKLLAERKVLEAVAQKGVDAKVIRVGSLSARESDGEFQINFLSNSAMEQLRSFALLKAFPYSNMSQDMRFGPIDASARSFMYLARSPKACCLFHAVNNHSTPAIDVIRVMTECGIPIDLVEDAEFLRRLQEADKDPEKAAILSSILAYKDMAKGAMPVEEKSEYTNQILARSGFFWNNPDDAYIRRFIEDMAGMGFFDAENLYR